MKNQDLVSKRILSLALAISMILCSAALFVFSLNFTGKAKAATTAGPSITTTAKTGTHVVGNDAGSISCAGISNGYVYYIYLAPDGYSKLWKAPLTLFKDSQ
jgi:hypothetical protein